uniref:Uncharacterized protein n=1 Tax=Mycena chlorophos TaxID=658473 RepID=A0ABQ0L5S6_MYCCL|nr:predicted protein [Mycena chlorophos]
MGPARTNRRGSCASLQRASRRRSVAGLPRPQASRGDYIAHIRPLRTPERAKLHSVAGGGSAEQCLSALACGRAGYGGALDVHSAGDRPAQAEEDCEGRQAVDGKVENAAVGTAAFACERSWGYVQ